MLKYPFRYFLDLTIMSAFFKNTALALCLALSLGAVTACQPHETTASHSPDAAFTKISGQTMGTSYHITVLLPSAVSPETVQAAIDARLDAINKSMSTYDDTATIMAFNRADVHEKITIDPDFIQVFKDSQTIYSASKGAFDPTVMPLVSLWGFGAKMSVERLQNPPTEAEITAIQDTIGLEKITLTDNTLQKTVAGVQLDFSAIAKGYAVDVIAHTLKEDFSATAYMVEIGGEIATHGKNPQGKAWQIAIDTPEEGSTAQNRKILTTVALADDHMATSGNYRNTLEYNGVRYSHTINPHTAHPVADGVPSVTVLHDSTALADGWATALTALPATDALALAERANIKALFVLKAEDGSWQLKKSTALENRPTP